MWEVEKPARPDVEDLKDQARTAFNYAAAGTTLAAFLIPAGVLLTAHSESSGLACIALGAVSAGVAVGNALKGLHKSSEANALIIANACKGGAKPVGPYPI